MGRVNARLPDERGIHERVQQITDEVGFSGVVRIDLDGAVVFEHAFGLANRALTVANAVGTQFATASGTKGFTALTVMSMVDRGELSLDTPVRSVLGNDLPLIDAAVTIEHLLAHRSGIGDYLNEDAVTDWTDYLMPVPVHQLATTKQYLPVLDGHPMKAAPDDKFIYNNGGFVVLALIAERVSGVPFHDLVDQRVCAPAGMNDTAFLRSDELPGTAALGYVFDDGLRTNVLHLPVRGSGDGGIYTTAADMHLLWQAVWAGRIVSAAAVAEMVRPRSDVPESSMRYGLGLWLHESSDIVSVHGFDPGVGCVSVSDPAGRFTHTALSNKSRGAWPVSQQIDAMLTTMR